MYNRNTKIADRSEYTVTDGVMRWKSNNHVPPEDIVAETQTMDTRIKLTVCDKARREDFTKFVAAVRERPTDSVASTVVFVPGTDLEKAKRWLEKAKAAGVIVSHQTKAYNSSECFPTLYFP